MSGTATSGFASLSPAQRQLAASVGSLTNWSRRATDEQRREATAPARNGMRAKWAREADPDGTLSPAELDRAIDALQRAHMKRMALASAKSRARAA